MTDAAHNAPLSQHARATTPVGWLSPSRPPWNQPPTACLPPPPLTMPSLISKRLDAVQRRALRLVGMDGQQQQQQQQQQQEEQTGVTSLEHRRDVSALVVQHKALGSGGPSSQLDKAPTTSCPEGVQDHHLQ
ncbi:hypothetical protein O3P69_011011 [Scylla paramamosain]|uniref:Uncharacterized protein n=1 Tax=Scylla paramamosain TaxID=85552 RepID=A0AAW0SGR5_SCYPA